MHPMTLLDIKRNLYRVWVRNYMLEPEYSTFWDLLPHKMFKISLQSSQGVNVNRGERNAFKI